MTHDEVEKRVEKKMRGVRDNAICFWAGVQIVIGLSLLGGTVYLAMSLLPKIRDGVGQVSEKLAAAAEAVRENNKSYCEFANNLFCLSESIGDIAKNFDEIGSKVAEAGESLHFEIPVLRKVNDVGDSVRDIGNDIVEVAAAIRKERIVMDEFQNRVHPQNSRTIGDAADGLKAVSELMQNGSMMEIYGWYVCLLGALLSLLFIMNGVILLVVGKETKKGMEGV